MKHLHETLHHLAEARKYLDELLAFRQSSPGSGLCTGNDPLAIAFDSNVPFSDQAVSILSHLSRIACSSNALSTAGPGSRKSSGCVPLDGHQDETDECKHFTKWTKVGSGACGRCHR
jgi:hypothetical protein